MKRRIRRRLRVAFGRVVPMVGLILLTAAVWLTVAYVCGRTVFVIQDADHFLRLLLPGIW